MPTIDLSQRITVTPQEARRRLDLLQDELERRFDLVPTWSSPTEAEVRRMGAGGTLRIEPGRVVVHIDLSFALTPLRGRIESELRRRLADLFDD